MLDTNAITLEHYQSDPPACIGFLDALSEGEKVTKEVTSATSNVT